MLASHSGSALCWIVRFGAITESRSPLTISHRQRLLVICYRSSRLRFHEDYVAAELGAVGSVNTPALARFVAGSSNSLPRQVWSDETGRCVAQTKLRWARPVDEYTSHVTHVTDIRCQFLCNGLHQALLLPGV